MRQIINYNPDDYPPYLEMVDFCLKHRDKLNEWQVEFIATREKWERWSDGGPTWNMTQKLIEAFLDVGGKPVNYVPTDDELTQRLRKIVSINQSISSCTFLLTGRMSSDSEGR